MPTISDLTLEDLVIDTRDPEIAGALGELYPKGGDLFPLCAQDLSFRLADARPAISSAFHRVMTQELTGHYLTAATSSMDDTTDPFMKPEFVINLRLQNIPLAHGLANPEALEFRLDVTNHTKAVMSVHAGDIELVKGKLLLPLFNPTIEVASLQPGKRIVIDKITVAEGMGRTAAPANVAIRGRHAILDLERLPRERTHTGMQGDAQRSGFVIPSPLASPKEFMVSVTIPAAARGSITARGLPTRACNNILMRLRQVMTIVDRADDPATAAVAKSAATSEVSSWNAWQQDGDEHSAGLLQLRNETATIIELLRTELNHLVPDIAYVGAVDSVEAPAIGLRISMRRGPAEMQAALTQACKNLVAVFTDLQSQL
jgi:hypothetical protein